MPDDDETVSIRRQDEKLLHQEIKELSSLTTKKEPDKTTTTVPVVVVSENNNQQGSNVPKLVVYQDDDVPMDVDDEDGNTNPSSETAGIVRGTTKTILRGSSKRAGEGVRMAIPKPVGKLIMNKVKKPSSSSAFPKKVPTRQVVKVSDRLSTGLDVFSSAEESSNSDGNKSTMFGKDSNQSSSTLKTTIRRALAFTGALLKNSVLGIAVFETYEQWIVRMDDDSVVPPPRQISNNTNNNHLVVDAYSRVSVYHHFIAGSLAGVAFSLGSLTMDWVTSRGRIIPTAALAISSTIHHALSNSILFGSYEGSKRYLYPKSHPTHYDTNNNTNNHDTIPSSNDSAVNDTHMVHHQSQNSTRLQEIKMNDTQSSVQISDILMISAAGSFAGVTQHIVSHYSESVLKMNHGGLSISWTYQPYISHHQNNQAKKPSMEHNSTRHQPPKFRRFLPLGFQQLIRNQILPLPTLRSTLVAIPATAIGFIAFEYGKDTFHPTE